MAHCGISARYHCFFDSHTLNTNLRNPTHLANHNKANNATNESQLEVKVEIVFSAKKRAQSQITICLNTIGWITVVFVGFLVKHQAIEITKHELSHILALEIVE